MDKNKGINMVSVIKAQTNGNDFVIMPNIKLSNEQIKYICDRHYGIGCDQLIMFKQINDNTFDLLFYNNDGSTANMCGNGSCAFALFVNKYINNNMLELYINVIGTKYKEVIQNNKISIAFQMPHYMNDGTTICTGNYHRVYDMKYINNVLEIQSKYPECNVHFIKENNNIVEVITYERGAGRTLACGSGAIAICFYLNKSIKIIHEGGTSEVLLLKNSIKLITQPKIVCECKIDLNN